jgi:hypothetical protein
MAANYDQDDHVITADEFLLHRMIFDARVFQERLELHTEDEYPDNYETTKNPNREEPINKG